jgi:hypothetical protein
MSFDARTIFANLAEKEKIKGHHSPEGRAIRTLSRALSGWASKNLSARDVLTLCDQAMEDWLKARLKVSAWSARTLPELATTAVEKNLTTASEALRLQRVHNMSARSQDERAVTAQQVNAALELCIQVVERHW